MTSSIPAATPRREALDSSILLCRDRLECSLEMETPLACPKLRTSAHAVGNALGLIAALLTICVGGYLAHIVR